MNFNHGKTISNFICVLGTREIKVCVYTLAGSLYIAQSDIRTQKECRYLWINSGSHNQEKVELFLIFSEG